MNRHTPIPTTAFKQSVVARTVGGLFRQVRGILKALEHRREVRSLAELDDRLLKDIGLSRSGVDGALAEPLFRDPSLVLVRSVERHTQAHVGGAEPRRERPVVKLVSRPGCA